jgi:uncharacterized protein YqfA (UPF0365 family)
LEEQEEVGCKRKRQDSEDGEDFMDEATADSVIGQAKDRRGKVVAVAMEMAMIASVNHYHRFMHVGFVLENELRCY